MEKKAYSKPRIFRVKLNTEQAVLSQCSEAAADIKNSNPVTCDPRCRQRNAGGRIGAAVDFEGSS